MTSTLQSNFPILFSKSGSGRDKGPLILTIAASVFMFCLQLSLHLSAPQCQQLVKNKSHLIPVPVGRQVSQKVKCGVLLEAVLHLFSLLSSLSLSAASAKRGRVLVVLPRVSKFTIKKKLDAFSLEHFIWSDQMCYVLIQCMNFI